MLNWSKDGDYVKWIVQLLESEDAPPYADLCLRDFCAIPAEIMAECADAKELRALSLMMQFMKDDSVTTMSEANLMGRSVSARSYESDYTEEFSYRYALSPPPPTTHTPSDTPA